MANVANTKHTGPVSKDTVSGGRQLKIQTKDADLSGHNLDTLTNTSDEARRVIMGMRIQSSPYVTGTPEATASNLRDRKTVGIPSGTFTPTR